MLQFSSFIKNIYYYKAFKLTCINGRNSFTKNKSNVNNITR